MMLYNACSIPGWRRLLLAPIQHQYRRQRRSSKALCLSMQSLLNGLVSVAALALLALAFKAICPPTRK
jgi:hypothetical protein